MFFDTESKMVMEKTQSDINKKKKDWKSFSGMCLFVFSPVY